MTDDQFFKMLKDMTDVQLAERIERGGMIFAPNPHFVLEAARRLRANDSEIARLRALVGELANVAEKFVSCKATECDTVCAGDAKCIHKKTIELIVKAREVAK